MTNGFLKEAIRDKIKRLMHSTADSDMRFAIWREVEGFIDGCFWCDRITEEEFIEYGKMACDAYMYGGNNV